jgi:glycosyltransferase involved in cell wall biosynthesis
LSRLRLLLTTDAVGGVWTYSLDLAAALAEAEDVAVTLAVLGPSPNTEQLTAGAATPGLQLIDTGLPLDWLAEDAATVRRTAEAVADIASACDTDVVQLHTPALASAGRYPVPVISVVHSCLRTWWAAVKDGPLPSDFAWRSDLVGEGLRRSDVVVTPTLTCGRMVKTAYALPHLPEAVHNGRKPSGVRAAAQVDAAFTAGRLWDEGKNVAAFDRAAALSKADFLAAGPLTGPDGSAARLRHARALGRLDGQALAAHLAARPVFVSPALYEPFGLSVLEAAQAGCALVLSDIPTFQELWAGAAVFVPAGDEVAIAEAVDRLIASPDFRTEMGEEARTRALAYTPELMADAMLGHYRALLGSGRRAAA